MNPYKQALDGLVRALRPQRALVLSVEDGTLRPREALGVDLDQPWLAVPISFALLEHVQRHGNPVLASDLRSDPRFGERSSAMMAEIRSVVCVPWWGPDGRVAGLLYADSRLKQGLFGKAELAAVQNLARDLEGQLGGRRPARPSAAVPQPPRAAAASPPTSASAARVRPQALPYLFRCLATLVGAGVGLLRALEVLAQGAEEPGQTEVLVDLARRVQAGQSLAGAMAVHAGSFSPFHLRLVGLGETSGALHRSLVRLADYEEKRLALGMEFKRTLTYPAILLVVCGAMLIVVPPYALGPQIELARQSGANLPWLSQAVAALSQALRHPAGQLLALGALGLATLALRRAWPWLIRLPPLGKLLRERGLAVFAQSLGHLLEAGIPLTQALPQAGACAGDSTLEAQANQALARMLEGQSLSAALAQGEAFPRSFAAVLGVGEESGELPRVLLWLGEFHEMQARAGLESLAAWLEPVIMMGMGVVVGVFLLATMIPMASALANL